MWIGLRRRLCLPFALARSAGNPGGERCRFHRAAGTEPCKGAGSSAPTGPVRRSGGGVGRGGAGGGGGGGGISPDAAIRASNSARSSSSSWQITRVSHFLVILFGDRSRHAGSPGAWSWRE